MNIDWILIKQTSILSAFFGAIIGFITVIPYISGISFIFLICFMAPLVIWLLLKYNCCTLSTMKEGIITGAISGFVSYLAFSLIYIPISMVLLKLFSYSANYGVGLIIGNSNFFLLMVVSIFMAVLGATTNAFSGFLTFCIIDMLRTMKK